jgi:hypothetical protein
VVVDLLLEDYATGGASTTTHTFEAVPVEVEVARNAAREADTCRVVLSYRQFPLDPRAVRGAVVAVFLGHVEDPALSLPTDSASYRVFLGVVDRPETSLDDSSETVTLEGRDYTAYLLDTPWSATVRLDVPLSQVVQAVLDGCPGTGGISVVWDDEAQRSQRLSDSLGRSAWTPRGKDDAWTVLTDLLGLVGLVPVVELDQLRITTADQLGRQQAVLVYGANVSRLTYRRQERELRTAQVQVSAWDEGARELRQGIWPADAAAVRVLVGSDRRAARAEGRVIVHQVYGSYTAQQLQALAKALYDDAVRAQVEGTIETREMRDGDGETDLWLLAAGDSVAITLGKVDSGAISGMSRGEAVAYLTAGHRGLDTAVAEALVTSWEQAEDLATVFQVRRATHRWTVDDGYSLVVEFQDYISAGS